MATQQVNERLAALTAAGTSIWLDQIKRALISTGELQRLVEEDSLRGVTSNPTIFNQAILGSDDYDEQLAELARAGKDNREIYQELAIRDIQDACDVLRVVYDESGGTDGFVSFEVDPDLAFDTAPHDRAGARVLGPRRPPQPDDQDPGHQGGHAGDRGDDLRGAQHQRHAALRRRGVRAGGRGLHPRPRAPPGGGQVGRHQLGRVVLRLARRHRGRQAPGGHRPRRPAGQGRHRQRPRRLPALRGDLPGRALRRPARRRRRGAAPAVGLDRRQEPRLPRRHVRRGARRAQHRQHDADGHAAGRRRPRRDPRQHRRRGPRPRPEGAGRRRHRHGRRHRPAAARGRRQVRRADGEAAGGHRHQAPGDRHPAPVVDRRLAARRRRAARRRARQAGRRRRTSRGASGARTTRSGARRASPRSPTASAG